MGWRYVLCDLDGRSLGELRGYSRSISVGVSQTAVPGVTVRQDDPLWLEVAAGEAMLKVYNSADTLVSYGPVVTDDETAQVSSGGSGGDSGSGATVAVTAADLSWELSRRFFATDTTGVGVTYTSQDSGAIARDILAKCNADYATWITAGTTGTFVQRTVTFLWKNALQAITELGGIAGSYEWGLRYVDGTPPTVYLDLTSQMGTDRTASVFLEFGTGKANVSKYEKIRSIDQQATTVWALGAGSTLVAQAQDTGAETTYKRRREDVVSYGDITVASLLQALASLNVTIRRYPYQIVKLTPLPQSTPRYGVDYFLGDIVSARVVVNGQVRVNGAVRVWGAKIAVDELGNECAELVLVPNSTSSLP